MRTEKCRAIDSRNDGRAKSERANSLSLLICVVARGTSSRDPFPSSRLGHTQTPASSKACSSRAGRQKERPVKENTNTTGHRNSHHASQAAQGGQPAAEVASRVLRRE